MRKDSISFEGNIIEDGAEERIIDVSGEDETLKSLGLKSDAAMKEFSNLQDKRVSSDDTRFDLEIDIAREKSLNAYKKYEEKYNSSNKLGNN